MTASRTHSLYCSEFNYLRVKGIPLVVELADKIAPEFLFFNHFVLQSREEKGVLSPPSSWQVQNLTLKEQLDPT